MEKEVTAIVKEILDKMMIDYQEVEPEKNDEYLYINIKSENDGKVLIGKDAQNIKAFNHVLKLILHKKELDSLPVFLDVNSYRRNQEDNIRKLAKETAEKVLETGSPCSLPPMSGYFRRIAHLYIAENFPDLETESSGEEYMRHILIRRIGNRESTDAEALADK
jgi:spoIIIJ-associated protein